MINHEVRTHKSSENLAREDQLAWKIAEVASGSTPVDADVTDMVINRIIDNAAVAAASVRRWALRRTLVSRRRLIHEAGCQHLRALPRDRRFSPEWAAWANGVAVRELDFHDTFLAAEYSHPGDNIPAVLAVAQHKGIGGKDLINGIATGYEIQVDLVKGMCLHEHKIDHVAHLGPSAAAGIGALLGLPTEVTFQAVQQALHVTTATRQSRKGEISSWKAHAPAFAGKMAVEAVDRAMRGEGAPNPIYEGEDGFIAWILSGPEARYTVPLPGQARRSVRSSTPTPRSTRPSTRRRRSSTLRASSARDRGSDEDQRVVIHTSHHTHYVIGTGANDPQKMDPKASRETLDHSIMYIFAVAMQDQGWHHEHSYAPERAGRPDTVELWHKIETTEDPEWTRRYHSTDPNEKAFGGRVEIEFDDGSTLTDEIAVADAHPFGARPFARANYIEKFKTLAEGVISDAEQARFLDLAENLENLDASGVGELSFVVDGLEHSGSKGIF